MEESKNHPTQDQQLDDLLRQLQPVGDVDVDGIMRRTFDKLQQQRRRQRVRIVSLFMSAAAAILLLVVLTLKVDTPDSHQPAVVAEAAAAEELQTLEVPVGHQVTLMLADGTRLTANSRSRVVYPKQFTGKTRDITVQGEVYLEVAHDANHPFQVHSGDFSLRVLGTKFNIHAYEGSRSGIVLVEGSVEVTTAANEVRRMKPGQLLDVSTATLTNVDPSDYTSWQQGILSLRGEPLSRVLEHVNDYYGTNYSCDASVAGHRFYGKLVMQPDAETVLGCLTEIYPFRVHTKSARK